MASMRKSRLDKTKLSVLRSKNTDLTKEDLIVLGDEIVSSTIEGFTDELSKNPKLEKLAKSNLELIKEFFIGLKEGVDAQILEYAETVNKPVLALIELEKSRAAGTTGGMLPMATGKLPQPTIPSDTTKQPQKTTEQIVKDIIGRDRVFTQPKDTFTGNAKDFGISVLGGLFGLDEFSKRTIEERQRKQSFVEAEQKLRPDATKKELERDYERTKTAEEDLRTLKSKEETLQKQGYKPEQIERILDLTTKQTELLQILQQSDPNRVPSNTPGLQEEMQQEQSRYNEKLLDEQEQQSDLLQEIRDLLKGDKGQPKKSGISSAIAAPSLSVPDLELPDVVVGPGETDKDKKDKKDKDKKGKTKGGPTRTPPGQPRPTPPGTPSGRTGSIATKGAELLKKGAPVFKAAAKAAPWLAAGVSAYSGISDLASGKKVETLTDILPQEFNFLNPLDYLSLPTDIAMRSGMYIGEKINKGYGAVSESLGGSGSLGGDIYDGVQGVKNFFGMGAPKVESGKGVFAKDLSEFSDKKNTQKQEAVKQSILEQGLQAQQEVARLDKARKDETAKMVSEFGGLEVIGQREDAFGDKIDIKGYKDPEKQKAYKEMLARTDSFNDRKNISTLYKGTSFQSDRQKQLAEQLGIDPSKLDSKLEGGTVTSINGQDVPTALLTDYEIEQANNARQARAMMSRISKDKVKLLKRAEGEVAPTFNATKPQPSTSIEKPPDVPFDATTVAGESGEFVVPAPVEKKEVNAMPAEDLTDPEAAMFESAKQERSFVEQKNKPIMAPAGVSADGRGKVIDPDQEMGFAKQNDITTSQSKVYEQTTQSNNPTIGTLNTQPTKSAGSLQEFSSAKTTINPPVKSELDRRVEEKLATYPEAMRSDIGVQNDAREEAEMEMKAAGKTPSIAKPIASSLDAQTTTPSPIVGNTTEQPTQRLRFVVTAKKIQKAKDDFTVDDSMDETPITNKNNVLIGKNTLEGIVARPGYEDEVKALNVKTKIMSQPPGEMLNDKPMTFKPGKGVPQTLTSAPVDPSLAEAASQMGKNIVVNVPPANVVVPPAKQTVTPQPFTNNVRNRDASVSGFIKSRYAF